MSGNNMAGGYLHRIFNARVYDVGKVCKPGDAAQVTSLTSATPWYSRHHCHRAASLLYGALQSMRNWEMNQMLRNKATIVAQEAS